MSVQVFKLVRVEDGTRSSYTQTPHSCEYRSGVKTTPSLVGSRLFALDTLEHGEAFLQLASTSQGEFEIWRCEADDPTPLELCAMAFKHMGRFWEGTLSPNEMIDTQPGTIACASITLLERVYEG